MDTLHFNITSSRGYTWIGIDSLKPLSILNTKFKFTATMQSNTIKCSIASDRFSFQDPFLRLIPVMKTLNYFSSLVEAVTTKAGIL